MANLKQEFSTFHNGIALTSSKKQTLRTSRDAIRERIRKHFRETLKLPVPLFRGQGSYAMGTTLNPIDGEYDIDDGIYLQHLDRQDDSQWPSVATVHQWIVSATDDHTNEKPIDKKTCVRVRYAGQYHVDLPIYGELNGNYLLAVKGESQWPQSDPMALTDWFIGQVKSKGEQLRRTVRYLKAWNDFHSKRRGKMANGLILTVLAASHFQGHDRDDIALTRTLQVISNAAEAFFLVLNPINSREALTDRLTDVQKIKFQQTVKLAAEEASQAIALEDKHKASKKWRNLFGDRFPLVDEQTNNESKKHTAASIAAFHTNRNPPKPWGWM